MTNKKRGLVKRIGIDYALTVASVVVSTGTLQLAVYPLLATFFDANDYGEILTIVGIVNIFIISLGNTLCNSRLVLETKYLNNQYSGDYKVVVLIFAALASIVVAVIVFSFFSVSITNAFLIMLFTYIGICSHYSVVAFRLRQDFRSIFRNSIITSLGYLLGLIIASISSIWVMPFVCAEVFTLLGVGWKYPILSEPLKTTPLLKTLLKTYLPLVASNLLAYVSAYFDRLILFPVLGGSAVSVFFAATVFGKAFSFLSGPLSTLLLSYLSKKDFTLSRKKYLYTNVLILLSGLIMIIVAVFFGPIVTKLLYPSLANEALQYMTIGNIGAIVLVLNSVNSTLLLKCAPTIWQVAISAVRLLLYAAVGLVAIQFFGMQGYCWAVLLTNSSLFVFTFILGLFYIVKPNAKS